MCPCQGTRQDRGAPDGCHLSWRELSPEQPRRAAGAQGLYQDQQVGSAGSRRQASSPPPAPLHLPCTRQPAPARLTIGKLRHRA